MCKGDCNYGNADADQQKVSFQILALQIDNQLSNSPYPIVLSFDNDHKGRLTNFLKNKEHALRIQIENTSPSTSECLNESVFYFTAAKWRNADASLVSFKYINLRYNIIFYTIFPINMYARAIIKYFIVVSVGWPLYASKLKNKYF